MHGVPPSHHPIPVFANRALILLYSASYFLLLDVASHFHNGLNVALSAALFAIVMIPVYSLIHEAEHNMLLPDERSNERAGVWLCCLFGVSFTFFTHCHLRHHGKNRTDIEMWDLYLERQSLWKRRLNLYLMLCGAGYVLIWLSVILFAFAPRLVYAGLFQRHTEIAGFLEGSDRTGKLGRIRRECWLVLFVQAGAFVLLGQHLTAWLALFAAHGFLWSSQNYVNHAFSPRDIVHGAHNLAIPVWLRPIYLNFNLHLAHHENPHVPWIHLPALVPPAPHRLSFFRNYLRLWTGPKLTREPDPLVQSTEA